MTPLARYEAARKALAECVRIDEAKEIRDRAEAMRIYARQAKDTELQANAAEIKLRAERRLGELIIVAKEAGLITRGQPPKKCTDEEHFSRVRLEEIGVDRRLSAAAQKTASIAERAFEAMVQATRERIASGRAVVVNPVECSRVVAPGRAEPSASLDYFPTAPWITRTLMEVVLPHLGVRQVAEAREPACGDGLMAEVLREYVPLVHASDIHDYGYAGLQVLDFLSAAVAAAADWQITNPPFGDLTLPFVAQMISLSRVGAAAFVRTQWACEGVGKYERLYRERPPTLAAFFMERAPVHRGRWVPDGDTMTAYCWLVWLHGQAPRAPLWIPPGQRTARERGGDAEHFTLQPVPRRDVRLDGPVDLITGEIAGTETAYPAGADDQSAGSSTVESSHEVSQSDVSRMPREGPAVSQRSARHAEPEDDGLDIPAFLRRPPPSAATET